MENYQARHHPQLGRWERREEVELQLQEGVEVRGHPVGVVEVVLHRILLLASLHGHVLYSKIYVLKFFVIEIFRRFC